MNRYIGAEQTGSGVRLLFVDEDGAPEDILLSDHDAALLMTYLAGEVEPDEDNASTGIREDILEGD